MKCIEKVSDNEFWLGVQESLPLILGVLPFGITCGIMAITAGLTSWEAVLMSLLVFAGASQFIGITMLGAGITSWIMIGLTTFLINLRHLLMGASLAPYMLRLPIYQQVLLAFGMVDESYVMTINRINQNGYSSSYQLGSSLAFYIVWILSTVLGAVLGGYINDPLKWGIDFAMPVTFLALLIPRLVDRTSLLVFLAAVGVAVSGAIYLPGKWYIIIACLVASLIGGLMEGGEQNAV